MHGSIKTVRAAHAARPSVVYYSQNGLDTLLGAVKAHDDPGRDYYFTVGNPAADKTKIRPSDAFDRVRVLPNVHPIAEFNIAAWRHAPGTWYEKGVQFRREMQSAGMGNHPSDMWAINEAGSGMRAKSPEARRNLAALLKGLYTGGGTMLRLPGVVFQQGPGYSDGLNNFLGDRKFWRSMKNYVRWYMGETYVTPKRFQGMDQAQQQHYIMGAPIVAPRSHPIHRLYAPMMSAFWGANRGYGNTQIPVSDMEQFVRQQAAAIRGQNVYGFAWNEHPSGMNPADLAALAGVVANPYG